MVAMASRSRATLGRRGDQLPEVLVAASLVGTVVVVDGIVVVDDGAVVDEVDVSVDDEPSWAVVVVDGTLVEPLPVVELATVVVVAWLAGGRAVA